MKQKKFREFTYSELRVDKCHETRHRSLPFSPPPPPFHRIPSSLRRPTRFNEPGMMTWYCHVGNLLSDSSGCPTTPLRFLCIATRPLRSSFFSSFPIPTGEDRLGARGRPQTTWRRVVDRLCVRACVHFPTVAGYGAADTTVADSRFVEFSSLFLSSISTFLSLSLSFRIWKRIFRMDLEFSNLKIDGCISRVFDT